MYVFGNPLKYIDPSGHCGITGNGDRDLQNDQACWTLVDSILNVYDDTDYFSNKYGISAEQFESYAEKDGITREFLFGELNLYNDYEEELYVQRLQDLKAYHENNPSHARYQFHPCLTIWDCRSMGYDVSSLGLSLAGDALIACTAPTAGLCGIGAAAVKTADAGVTIESARYAVVQHANGNSSDIDLSISLAANGASLIPGVGWVAPLISLGWSMIDPIVPEEYLGSIGKAY